VKANIPSKIKIGGSVFDVVFCKVVDEDDRNVDGKVIYSDQQIKLALDMHPTYTTKVLLHEIIHGVFDFLCFEQDETQVERLTNVLFQVLVDNKLHFDEMSVEEDDA
jgi:hypothetical protein